MGSVSSRVHFNKNFKVATFTSLKMIRAVSGLEAAIASEVRYGDLASKWRCIRFAVSLKWKYPVCSEVANLCPLNHKRWVACG